MIIREEAKPSSAFDWYWRSNPSNFEQVTTLDGQMILAWRAWCAALYLNGLTTDAARPQEPTASQQVRQLVAKLRKRDIADSAYKDSQFWKDLYALLDQLDEAALATQASQPPEAQDALAKAHDEGLREGIKVGFIGGERSMAEKAGQELTNIWIGGMTTQEVRTAFLATIRALAAVEPPQEPKP